jgi:ABC-type sugar transport system ATPase subunit
VFHIADRIVVLERGEKIFDKKKKDTTIEEIAQMIAKETVHLH